MARIRSIKPEFPQSESMGRVSRDARLLFILLWTIADDHGRTRAHSRMLASLLFPYDDDAGEKLPGWMTELENEGCIRLYDISGSQYLQIVGWSKHQKIDKPSKPQFPDPPDDTREASRDTREHSSEEGKGREGIKDQGREGKGEDQLRLTPLRDDEARHAVNGFQPIIDAYHEKLPRCLRITVLNPKRKRRLAAVRKLAKQVCESQGWTYDEARFFGAYFDECAEDPWMRGEVANPRNAHWKQNLDVLLAEDRFATVMDRAIEAMRGDT